MAAGGHSVGVLRYLQIYPESGYVSHTFDICCFVFLEVNNRGYPEFD